MIKAILTSEPRTFLLILEKLLFIFLMKLAGKKWSKPLTDMEAVRALPRKETG